MRCLGRAAEYFMPLWWCERCLFHKYHQEEAEGGGGWGINAHHPDVWLRDYVLQMWCILRSMQAVLKALPSALCRLTTAIRCSRRRSAAAASASPSAAAAASSRLLRKPADQGCPISLRRLISPCGEYITIRHTGAFMCRTRGRGEGGVSQ